MIGYVYNIQENPDPTIEFIGIWIRNLAKINLTFPYSFVHANLTNSRHTLNIR